MVRGVGPLLDHRQQEGGDEVVDLADQRARHGADPEAERAEHEVQPAVEPVRGERGAARRAGDADVAADGWAQCRPGTRPSRSSAARCSTRSGRRTGRTLRSSNGTVAALQPAAAQQLADQPAAAVADQVQLGPLGQQRQRLLRVLDRAASRGYGARAPGSGRGRWPPAAATGRLRRQRPRTSPACWRRCRAGTAATARSPVGQPLLDRRQRRRPRQR